MHIDITIRVARAELEACATFATAETGTTVTPEQLITKPEFLRWLKSDVENLYENSDMSDALECDFCGGVAEVWGL